MKKTNKFLQFVIAFAAVAIMFQVIGLKAEAKAKPTLCLDPLYSVNYDCIYGFNISNLGDYKIVKAVSSKPTVVKIEKTDWNKSYGFVCKKKGQATLTVTLKKGSKKITLTGKVVVTDEKPFKYIKYGKTEVYEGHEYNCFMLMGQKPGKALTWKLNKGYKITECYTFIDGKRKNLKNGSKINSFGEYQQITIFFTIQNEAGNFLYYSFDIEKNFG